MSLFCANLISIQFSIICKLPSNTGYSRKRNRDCAAWLYITKARVILIDSDKPNSREGCEELLYFFLKKHIQSKHIVYNIAKTKYTVFQQSSK